MRFGPSQPRTSRFKIENPLQRRIAAARKCNVGGVAADELEHGQASVIGASSTGRRSSAETRSRTASAGWRGSCGSRTTASRSTRCLQPMAASSTSTPAPWAARASCRNGSARRTVPADQRTRVQFEHHAHPNGRWLSGQRQASPTMPIRARVVSRAMSVPARICRDSRVRHSHGDPDAWAV